jgi:putative ABC transport system ATP-binding protein
MELIKMEDVKKKYQKGDMEVLALNGVNLSINKGEFLSIVGPSGSGKTTLLNIIGCLDTLSSGKVIYDEKELGKMNEKDLSNYRKENIGFIFQSYNLIPVLTVQENVELPMVIEKKWSKSEMSERALKIIEDVGLKGMENRYPREISGGQEQRVAIARALVKNPLLVLADEPTANLDSHTAEEVIDIMREINEKRKTTFVFSTHDPLVQKHAKRIIVLHDGNIQSDERR